jgi:elongator complex protein 3
MKPAELLLKEIREGKITTPDELELRKLRLAEGDLVKNSEILDLVKRDDPDYDRIRKILQIKHVRTASGVANIAVMWMHGKSCPGNCIYCPDKEGVPRSYTGVEPTTLRAIRNNYDPFLQITNRLKQLQAIGHSTDKCELIIMGGTFLSSPKDFQEEFVKKCLDAFNESESRSLEEAQALNETAKNRCVGLTIETRADFCSEEDIDNMLKLGCTRVEIGVQTTDDSLLKAIRRGHTAQDNIDAIKRLKDSGLKVCVHWMPGLTGLNGPVDEKKEIEMFKLLLTEYSPDELKIYPTLVIEGTDLHRLWKEGKYHPLEKEQLIRLLTEFKKAVPEWVRIKRVMRDISEHKAEAGVKTTNLRQLVTGLLHKQGVECRCIRCREAGHTNREVKDVGLRKIEYDGEIFLSYEGNGVLLGFLRLRLGDVARVRELHVYGTMAQIGRRTSAWQHKGIGKSLLEETENIAKQAGIVKITVTSGVGVRDYYRKLGYVLEGHYMTKKLV